MRARRRPIVDEYVEDGRAAVYADDGVVVLLSELATQAWAALGEDWVFAEDVAEVLVAEFGPPPEGDGAAAQAMTEQTLRSLAEQALVEIEEPTS